MPWRKLLPARGSTPEGVVYLLHFCDTFGGGKGARHYIGFSHDKREATDRVVEHLTGKGTPLVRHVVNAGITVLLAAEWHGATMVDEYRFKNRGGAGRWCPVCRAERMAGRTVDRWQPVVVHL